MSEIAGLFVMVFTSGMSNHKYKEEGGTEGGEMRKWVATRQNWLQRVGTVSQVELRSGKGVGSSGSSRR